jgi:hypothetical protein
VRLIVLACDIDTGDLAFSGADLFAAERFYGRYDFVEKD